LSFGIEYSASVKDR